MLRVPPSSLSQTSLRSVEAEAEVETSSSSASAGAQRPFTLRPLSIAPFAAHLPPKVTLGTREYDPTGRTLRAINGLCVEQLHATMRPGYAGLGGSVSGFLGPDQTLQGVLEHDQRWFTETGHTPQAIAWPLFLALAAGRQGVDEFLFNGQVLAVTETR